MAWRPILDGILADRAWDAVLAIARDLEPWNDEPGGFEGHAGHALFYHYLHRARPGEGWDERAATKLERAFEAVAAGGIDPWLAHGVAGVAWIAEHMHGPFADEDDPNGDVDAYFEELLAGEWQYPLDLIDGLGSVAQYFLARLPRPNARAALARVVEHYEKAAIADDGGGVHYHELGEINFGTPHGLPGHIGVLARIATAGISSERATALAGKIGTYLVAHAAPRAPRWGATLNDQGVLEPAVGGWCYGDLTVAASLRRAGRTKEAADILTEWIGREHEVKDACLCHGSASMAMLFTSADALDEAKRWLERTLELRGEAGVGGFLFWNSKWMPLGGLGGGSTGVGLTLMMGLGVDPGWKEILVV
jgi:hypothetical protein